MTLQDGVLEVALTWPEARNALGPGDAEVLTARLLEGADERCRCVVLHAEGSAFCAGGNLRAVWRLVGEGEAAVRGAVYGSYQQLVRTIRTLPVPVVAAVDGPAIGLGFDLALACDLRFFGRGAWVQQGWSTFGLIPATGGFHALRELGGPTLAWSTLLDRKLRLGPGELEARGLGRAVEDGLAAARAAARELAELPREVLTGAKQLIATTDHEEHLAIARELQVANFMSDRFAAQVRATFGLPDDPTQPR